MKVSIFVFGVLFACVCTVAQANKAKFDTLLGGFASVLAKGAPLQSTSKCMDEPTAARVISTIADLIKQASTCQVTKAVTLGNKAKALVASIPADQKQCFMNDPTAKIIASGLGISVASPEKSMDKIVQKAIRYAIGHISEVCKSLKTLNSEASSGSWEKFGVDSARTLKKVLA